jgi:hypothetical protein
MDSAICKYRTSYRFSVKRSVGRRGNFRRGKIGSSTRVILRVPLVDDCSSIAELWDCNGRVDGRVKHMEAAAAAAVLPAAGRGNARAADGGLLLHKKVTIPTNLSSCSVHFLILERTQQLQAVLYAIRCTVMSTK